MKEDDEIKEFLGKMFADFESEPSSKAWENIQGALSNAPRSATWPKIITGALIGVFCTGICHAPVHSQFATIETKTNHLTSVETKALKTTEPTLLASNAKARQVNKLTEISKTTIPSPALHKEVLPVKPAFAEQKSTQTEENPSINSQSISETITLKTGEETTAFQPELLNANEMKELPSIVGTPEVPVLAQPKRAAGSIKLWSVSVMPLATYQRMYVVPEATEQINKIHEQQALNGHRTGVRIGTELTFMRDRTAWRFGMSYTQMRQRLQYSVSTNQYTLTTPSNAAQPMVNQQIAQAEEVNEWHLVGFRADRQYQLVSNGRQRYFVSVGTEGAVDLAGRQPYLWGHLSVGIQKLLTPRVWLSVEPTASYSLISRTTTNGLLRVNPYNFGVKVSLGLMP
ncbi:hypothetical protein [Runella sp.]|uniref:hypothetical protein n=1 Tax=Runella sp. TaxID=1960881 RepID=UPI003D0ED47F